MRTRLLRGIALFSLSCILILSVSCAKKPPETIHRIPYTSLGIPTEAAYPDGNIARSPWDMLLYKDVLYVGSGDYDKNKGPIAIHAYRGETDEWSASDALPEEEINRFLLLDGTPTTLGIDPREGWELGNYYTLDGDEWIKHRELPGGVHCYDAVLFDSVFFAGLGVESGYPVVYSIDGGESYDEVPFYKDGSPVDTSGVTYIRTYDFLVLEDTLYATLTLGTKSLSYELYRYDAKEGVFTFARSLSDDIVRLKYNHLRITADAVFGDELFLVTGKMYATKDMTSFREIKLDGAALICDLYTVGDALYLLTATKENDEEGAFKTSVWRAWVGEEGETTFIEIFNFYYDVPPLSLATDGENFYVGMSDSTAKNELNGTVLHVKYPK